MSNNKSNIVINTFTIISFLTMIIVNALANTIPINDLTTGEISALYENLFTPAPITFSIWGLIYILLAIYTIYQLKYLRKRSSGNKELLCKIGVFFTLSSLANASWIFAWHYLKIPLSLVIMIVMLICLIIISGEINRYKLSSKENFFIKLPFSIYFGWITIATIANVTTLLVSINWNGFGLPEQIWTIIVIIIGLIIGGITTIKNNSISYGLVIIWAYIGIIIKHISENGYNKQYPAIIITSIISIIIMLIIIGRVKSNRKKEGRYHL